MCSKTAMDGVCACAGAAAGLRRRDPGAPLRDPVRRQPQDLGVTCVKRIPHLGDLVFRLTPVLSIF
jgi:hypothetical protein